MKVLRVLLSVWVWLVVAVVAIVGCTIQGLLLLVTLPFDPQRHVAGRFFRLMGVTCIKLSPNLSFSVHGRAPRRIRGRTVVVSNHASNVDCFLISFLPWEMKWLGKASLFKVPFIGWSMHFAGDIPMVRGSGPSVAHAMARCKEYLQNNMPVCIFPEGTRTRTGELLPFKDGAFRLAIEAGANILPIAVAGTRTALPKNSMGIGITRAMVSVGQPISTAGLTLENVEKLKAETRAKIQALIDEMEPIVTPQKSAAEQHSPSVVVDASAVTQRG